VSEQVARERYQLTIDNAREFISEHRKCQLHWRPIGAVQGWDPNSYAAAAEKYVKMGYDYIALGGLVRSKTHEILKIVEEVSKVVPRSVDVHLFGLARLEAMRRFSDLGITSVDSASHLRRAWLGASDNYWTLEGEKYAALRIPQPKKKQIQDLPGIQQLEQKCLETVRNYAKGQAGLQETLNILEDYDARVMGNRKSMRHHYERTLLNEPWKKCPCDICKKEGIEVIIFRGNNRNRRRGFHNTYVFYSLLKTNLT
jgi:queuine/archaeosine tRNA-ribosyltransferase